MHLFFFFFFFFFFSLSPPPPPPPPPPHTHTRTACARIPSRPTRITWVARTAASRRLVGVCPPYGQQQPKELTACAVPDTVVTVRDRIVRDTIVQQVKIPDSGKHGKSSCKKRK